MFSIAEPTAKANRERQQNNRNMYKEGKNVNVSFPLTLFVLDGAGWWFPVDGVHAWENLWPVYSTTNMSDAFFLCHVEVVDY